jgi:hypothetical protein
MIGLQKQIMFHSSRIFHSYTVELMQTLFCLCNLFYKFVIFEEEIIKKNIDPHQAKPKKISDAGLGLATMPDPSIMGLTTMANPNALGLTIIFSVTPRHVG